jgi:hypothetical protein
MTLILAAPVESETLGAVDAQPTLATATMNHAIVFIVVSTPA